MKRELTHLGFFSCSDFYGCHIYSSLGPDSFTTEKWKMSGSSLEAHNHLFFKLVPEAKLKTGPPS